MDGSAFKSLLRHEDVDLGSVVLRLILPKRAVVRLNRGTLQAALNSVKEERNMNVIIIMREHLSTVSWPRT